MKNATAALLAMHLGLCGCGGSTPPRPPPGDPLDQVSAEELFQRGQEAASRRDYVRAEQYLAAAIQRGYAHPDAMKTLVLVCLQGAHVSTALRYAEPYLEQHPRDWALRLLVATLQISLRESSAARTHLEAVLHDRPEEPLAHYLFGVIARDFDVDPRAAATHFGRYIDLAPEGEHVSEAREALRQAELVRAAEADPTSRPVLLPPHLLPAEATREEAVQ